MYNLPFNARVRKEGTEKARNPHILSVADGTSYQPGKEHINPVPKAPSTHDIPRGS